MYCKYFAANQCLSCSELTTPYPQQLIRKQQHLKRLLNDIPVKQYLEPVASKVNAFRNKAKMAVAGSVESPILGINRPGQNPIDLCDCPLYSHILHNAFPVIKQFIGRVGLTPYNVNKQRGELKYILITQNEYGELLLRFILRSKTKLAKLQAALPWLMTKLPNLSIVSVNIQPVHMAILEGDEEINLTEKVMLRQTINNIPLYIKAGSFFQTNTFITEKLYATAKEWVSTLAISDLWDLFCGVGGFGLHCKTTTNKLTGIEINQEAIECAQRSIAEMAFKNILFKSLDSTAFALQQVELPDMVLVNPPRRGIGQELCHYLGRMSPPFILYSSCNAITMINDITALENYQIEKIQLFDMFPNTTHYEVLALLKHRNK